MGLAELKQKEKDFSREEIIARETAKVILESGAFQLFFGKPITFSSGIRSPMKIEADKISGSSRELQKVVGLLSQLMDIEGLKPDVIAGVISGGVPFARELARLRNCHFVARPGLKRSKRKLNQVEGDILQGQKVLVLDDIFTTGMNSILAAEDIQREGGIVSSCLAIFDYGFSISGRNFSQKSFKAYATTQFPIFLGLAQRPEYDQLSFEEAQELLLWYEGIQKSFG